MATQPSDTNPEIEKVWFDLLRKASNSRRLEIAISLSNTVRQLSREAIAQEHPEMSKRERDIFFVRLHYGNDLAERVKRYLEQRDDEEQRN